jgi:hypothetical protein
MADKDDTHELPSTPKAGYVTVYDLEGKPHTLTHLNAWDATQHLGWSRKIAKAPDGAAPASDKVVVLVSKKAPANIKPEDAEHVDLNTLDIDQLLGFAKEHFSLTFPPGTSREKIIATLVEERG